MRLDLKTCQKKKKNNKKTKQNYPTEGYPETMNKIAFLESNSLGCIKKEEYKMSVHPYALFSVYR